MFLLTVQKWTYVIPAQITLRVKVKEETDLTVHPQDFVLSFMLHTLSVNKALSMLRYPMRLALKETEFIKSTCRTVWLSQIEVTSMRNLSRI